MSAPVIALATEAAKAGDYPQKLNRREQKLAEAAKTYVDATAASVSAAKISDTAYNASSWDAVTTIAPSKNAVRDQVETMLTSIGTKQAAITMGQATTGTGGDVGKITLAGMTATGKIIVTAAEDPGTSLVISDVVADTGIVTVFTKNTDTNARAGLSGKKVNYIVISLS
jgi:hypothetical protein